MANPLARAQELARVGRFKEALANLQTDASDSRAGAQVLRVEMLERTGEVRAAKVLTERLLSRKKLDGALRARLLTTRGIIQLEEGKAVDSIDSLTSARELALEDKATSELFWSELRLLLAEFERSPGKGSSRLLADVRKHAIQLGDSNATIALHLFFSEVEAKRGAITNSRRHLKVARELLQTYPNLWLEGLALICEFCLAYLVGDLVEAERAAIRALRASHLSGHARTELAAVVDIAHIRLRQGKLDETNHLLRQALRLCSISTRVREYVYDGLAQLAFTKGEVAKSERLLSELSDPAYADKSYPKLWSYPTKAKLLLARQCADDAKETCAVGLTFAASVGDQSLIMRLRLLHAEACGRAGDIPAAGKSLQAAALGHKDPSLELLAEYYRVSSQLLAADGDQAAAAPGLERGRRILTAIGHTHAASDLPAPAVPEAAVAHPATERSDVTTARAAALFNQAARADLIGDELTALLFRVGAARAVACVATTADGTPHLVSARGWSDAEALAALAVTPPLPRLELGTWRERHWSLIVDVPSTVTARTAFVAVRTLADCSRTVDTSRRQEREKSALWQMDPVEDATHGVFASEVMLDLIRTVRRVAQTPVTILLTGETGTGKDILARLIHECSPRAGKLFVPFNCTAVPREMLDSSSSAIAAARSPAPKSSHQA